MKWFSSLSINSKILLSVSVTFIIGIIIFVVIITNRVSHNISESTRDTLTYASMYYANHMKEIFNETITLTGVMSSSINEIFQHIPMESIRFTNIESIIKNTLDNSGYATYAFLYILNTPEEFENMVDYKTRNNKFIALYHSDGPTANTTSRVIANDSLLTMPLITEILNSSGRGKNSRNIFVGIPTKNNFTGNEFVGLNMAAPIFNSNHQLIGIVGLSIDFANITRFLTDPKLDLHESDLRVLLNEQGTVAIHSNPSLILQNIQEINKALEAKKVINAIKNHENNIFDDYVATTGMASYASVYSFVTLHDTSHWSVLVTTPRKAVLQTLDNLIILVWIASAIFLIVVLSVIYFCIRKIVGIRLPIILNTLTTFFRFLNHENVKPSLITIRANDELGAMGKAINENIERAQANVQKDSALVNEAFEVINHTCGGHATRRITLNGANPQLNALKDSVNQLLDLLSSAIGNDLPELNRVFDSFVKLDFSTEVKDAQGRVLL